MAGAGTLADLALAADYTGGADDAALQEIISRLGRGGVAADELARVMPRLCIALVEGGWDGTDPPSARGMPSTRALAGALTTYLGDGPHTDAYARTLFPLVASAVGAVGGASAFTSSLTSPTDGGDGTAPAPMPPPDLWNTAYADPLRVLQQQHRVLAGGGPAAQLWLEALAATGAGAVGLGAALWTVGLMGADDDVSQAAVVSLFTKQPAAVVAGRPQGKQPPPPPQQQREANSNSTAGLLDESKHPRTHVGGEITIAQARVAFLATWCVNVGGDDATAALQVMFESHPGGAYTTALQGVLDEVAPLSPAVCAAMLKTWVAHGAQAAILRAVQHPPRADSDVDAIAGLLLDKHLPQLSKILRQCGAAALEAPLLQASAHRDDAGSSESAGEKHSAKRLLSVNARLLWCIMGAGQSDAGNNDVLAKVLADAHAIGGAATALPMVIGCAMLPDVVAEASLYLLGAMQRDAVAGLLTVILAIVAHDRDSRRHADVGNLLTDLSRVHRDALASWVSPEALFRPGGQSIYAGTLPASDIVDFLTSIDLTPLRLDTPRDEQLLKQAVRMTLDCVQAMVGNGGEENVHRIFHWLDRYLPVSDPPPGGALLGQTYMFLARKMRPEFAIHHEEVRARIEAAMAPTREAEGKRAEQRAVITLKLVIELLLEKPTGSGALEKSDVYRTLLALPLHAFYIRVAAHGYADDLHRGLQRLLPHVAANPAVLHPRYWGGRGGSCGHAKPGGTWKAPPPDVRHLQSVAALLAAAEVEVEGAAVCLGQKRKRDDDAGAGAEADAAACEAEDENVLFASQATAGEDAPGGARGGHPPAAKRPRRGARPQDTEVIDLVSDSSDDGGEGMDVDADADGTQNSYDAAAYGEDLADKARLMMLAKRVVATRNLAVWRRLAAAHPERAHCVMLSELMQGERWCEGGDGGPATGGQGLRGGELTFLVSPPDTDADVVCSVALPDILLGVGLRVCRSEALACIWLDIIEYYTAACMGFAAMNFPAAQGKQGHDTPLVTMQNTMILRGVMLRLERLVTQGRGVQVLSAVQQLTASLLTKTPASLADVIVLGFPRCYLPCFAAPQVDAGRGTGANNMPELLHVSLQRMLNQHLPFDENARAMRVYIAYLASLKNVVGDRIPFTPMQLLSLLVSWVTRSLKAPDADAITTARLLEDIPDVFRVVLTAAETSAVDTGDTAGPAHDAYALAPFARHTARLRVATIEPAETAAQRRVQRAVAAALAAV